MPDAEEPGNEIIGDVLESVDVIEDSAASLENIPEEQQMEAKRFALDFIKRVLRLMGVRIDREHFLRSELHRRGVGIGTIDLAISLNPASACIPLATLDRIVSHVLEVETRNSTAMSFAAKLPGGFAMIGTIPGDITQF